MNLDFLKIKEEEDSYVLACCPDCYWEGEPNCETIEEQEGWENPPYLCAICPECGETSVEYIKESEMPILNRFDLLDIR